MLTTTEIALVAVLAVLIVAGGVFGSRFAANADEEMRAREAERAPEGPQAKPARPAQPTKKPRRRR